MELFQTPEEHDDLDPLVAGIFGNLRALWEKYTSAERRANVKKQLRDRYGRWIDMGKSAKFKLRDSSGNIQSYIGTFVGLSDIKDHGRFLVIDSKTGERKIYHIASGNLQQVEGVIDTEYLQGLGLLDDDGNPDETKLGDDFQDISDIKIEDPTDDDEESAKLEIPDLPDMAKIVRGQKSNPTKRRNVLPGAIVQGADSNAYALVTDVETKDGETTLFLRFQNGERRVAKGSANGSVLAWMTKEPEAEKKEAPSIPDLNKVAIPTERVRIGDRVFDNVSESYATIEAVSRSEDGKSLDITIRFADGREQTVTRPIDQPITVWREPNIGTAGKTSEELARIGKEEKPKKEKPEKEPRVPRSAMPRGLSNLGKIQWELERKGKPLSTWNILWTFPFGVPQDAVETRRKIAEEVGAEDVRFPVSISEVTGDALENIKKLNNMGGKVKDMLPKTEEEFDRAVKYLIGEHASRAEIEAAKEMIRKKAEDDTREFKIVRVGHNFFVRFREGDDMPPEKLAAYLQQVANLASKTTLGETPIFITLLNDGEIGAGGRAFRKTLHGFTFYNPKRDSDGVQISVNTSLFDNPRHGRTVYHEFGHAVHHILTGYNMDKNAPNALRFRLEFADEIKQHIADTTKRGFNFSPETAEKELFADLYADMAQALFDGRTDLVNKKFLDFYNSIVTGDIYDGTYNALTRQLFGEPVEVPEPEPGTTLTTPQQSEAQKKGVVHTADGPFRVGIGSYVWTSEVTGTLERFQIGDILPPTHALSPDAKVSPAERAEFERQSHIRRPIVLLIRDENGDVVKKAIVSPSNVYHDKDNAPIQQKNGLTSADEIVEAFKQKHPNFADQSDPEVRKLFSFNTPDSIPGMNSPRPRHTAEYAGGSLFIDDRQAGQTSPRVNEAGQTLYRAMAFTEKGQSINGYGNNVFESTDPEEALRKAAELLADYNSNSDASIATIIEATAKQEDLTPEEYSKYSSTTAVPSNVPSYPTTTTPATTTAPQQDQDNTPRVEVKTTDGSTFRFFDDGRITGVGHSNKNLFYPVVDASGSVIIRSIEIRSQSSSPMSYIKSDKQGNLTHVRVDQNTGEVFEVDLGNITEMFTDKDAARKAGADGAKQKGATVEPTAEPEEEEKPQPVTAQSPQPLKIAQANAIGAKAKELLKLVEPTDEFKVEDGTRQTRSALNFSGIGQPNNGGFGGFTFQPDPSKNTIVAVITGPDGKEVSRHVIPEMPGRPIEVAQRAADFQLARGIAAADHVVQNPESDIDTMYSEDAARDSVSVDYGQTFDSPISTDYRAPVFSPEYVEQSDEPDDIDNMISKPWKSRLSETKPSVTSNKIIDKDNPIETLHPGALVLDSITGQIGRVRGVAVEVDEETGKVTSPGGWQVEFFNGPVSALSGINPVTSTFNEFGQRTQVVGDIHPTATGSDFDDRRFYTIEVRDPEDFTNVTKSFIADSPEGPVLIHDSSIGLVKGIDGVARVAGFSGEGKLIVSIENLDGTTDLKEISVSEFKPLSISVDRMAPHGSVVGDRFFAESSITQSGVRTIDAIRVLGTLNNMAFIDKDVARALLRSITNGHLTSSGLSQVLNNLDSHEAIRKIKVQSGRGQLNRGAGLAIGNAANQTLVAAENMAKSENGEEPPITVSRVVESEGVRRPSNRQLKSVERRLALPGILPEERLKEIWDMLPDLDSRAIGPVIQELDNAELMHRMDQGLPLDDIFERRASALFGHEAVKVSPEVAERLKTFVPTKKLDGTPLDEPVDPMEDVTGIDEMSEEPVSEKSLDGIRLSQEQSEVFSLVENTNTPIFITGKAGTGKSTLLKFLRTFSRKGRGMVVVAPSGMAALNVDGVTIPRVFPGDFYMPYWAQNPYQLLYGNGADIKPLGKFRLAVLQNMEVLVIDEVSMVNADTIDHMDRILRAAKHQPGIPFGGVQVLMFGDPYQLPPVVKEDASPNSHATTFKENYQSPWFFHANVWGYQDLDRVQLNQVFRQKDPEFIDILNAVRNGTASIEQLDRLNKMGYFEDPSEIDQNIVRIYAKRIQVLQRNNEMLDKLPGEEVSFLAQQQGKIYREDDDSSPAPVNLRVKVGARVLFLENDRDHRFVNGSGGTITAIGKDSIMVLVDGSPKPIEVKRHSTYGKQIRAVTQTNGTNIETKMESSGDGSIFKQFPFQIGYAITIHKSQGQSYDAAVIDVDGVFAAGQGYVALSRVRSPQGLHLTTKVEPRHMITDPNVGEFMYDLEFDEDGKPIKTTVAEPPTPLGEQATPDSSASKTGSVLLQGVSINEARDRGLVETPKFVVDFKPGDYIFGYDTQGELFGWQRILKVSEPRVIDTESGDQAVTVEVSDGTRTIREVNGRVSTERLTEEAIKMAESQKVDDERPGDIDLMEEPFDPTDVDVDPIGASGIKDITRYVDGSPISEDKMTYINNVMRLVGQMQSYLDGLENSPKLFEGDEESQEAEKKLLRAQIQDKKKRVVQYWNALEGNVRTSKPSNTADVVKSRIKKDDSRSNPSLTVKYVPSREQLELEATKGKYPVSYSTYTYTDQYGREYMIGSITYVPEDANDRRPSGVDMDDPKSYTFAIDKNSPDFESINKQWNATISAAKRGVYSNQLGFKDKLLSSWLSVDDDTIAMINTDPLYQRRGLATAITEVARDTIGEGHTVNHSSTITSVAQAWSDVIDADRPDLRSYVPDHEFERDSDIDEMSDNWLLNAFKDQIAKAGLDPDKELERMGITVPEDAKNVLDKFVGDDALRFQVLDNLIESMGIAPNSREFLSNLSDSQRESLGEYIGTEYRQINRYLREGAEYGDDIESINRVVSNLDAIFSKVSPTKDPTVSFRGVNFIGFQKEQAKKLFKDIKIGDVLEDSGFSSTSQDPRVSWSTFGPGYENADEGGAFMIVNIPVGSRVLAVPASLSNTAESELEVLIPRGSRFKVLDVKTTPVDFNNPDKGSNYFLEVELISDNESSDSPDQVEEEEYKDISNFNKISDRRGHTEGGLYKDPETGKTYYVKLQSVRRGQNEALAAALYNALGVKAIKIKKGVMNGDFVTYSEWLDDLTLLSEDIFERTSIDPVFDGFAVDAWLANWDAIGAGDFGGFDNIAYDKNNNAVRIDAGGALLYRGAGARKYEEFGDQVNELKTFKDPAFTTGQVFENISFEQEKASAKKLLTMSPQKIDDIVDKYISNAEDRAELKEKLKARREFILDHYGLDDDIDNMEEWEPKEGLTSGKGKSDFLDDVVDGDYLNLDAAPDSPVLVNFTKEELVDNEHDSLFSYTQSWYKPLNKRLRGIKDPSIGLESTLDRMIDDLDAIIDTYGDVFRDAVVFRGMSGTSDLHKYLETAEVGDVYRDVGYMSTSNDSSVALRFGSAANASFKNAAFYHGEGRNSSFWAITIPSGGKALALPKYGYGYGSEEREVILPRDSRLKINAIRRVPHVDDNGEELGTYNYYVDATALVPGSEEYNNAIVNTANVQEPKNDSSGLYKLSDMIKNGDQATQKIREAFNQTLAGNYMLELPNVKDYTDAGSPLHEIVVNGRIIKDNAEVGDYELVFYVNTDKDEIYVSHTILGLYKQELRGKGFGTAYGEFSKALYKKLGVQKIKLNASLDDGPYVWAKAGFEWDPEHGKPAQVIESLTDFLDRLEVGDLSRDLNLNQKQKLKFLIKSLLGRMKRMDIRDPDYPKPFEIANLPKVADINVAREILGRDIAWDGMKNIEDIDEMSDGLDGLTGKALTRALLKAPDKEVKSFLSEKFAEGDFGDFEVEIATAFNIGDMGALDFGGIVYTTGEAGRTVVGTFSRAIDIGSDGEYAVYSEGLTIEKEYRGRGFGTKFSKFSEDLYRSMGISKIYLTAGEEDGSYVWAKAGYDWADTPTRVVFQIKKLIDDVKNKDDLEFEPGEKSKILDALADYRDRFNDLELSDKGYPTPIEIANTMIGNYNLGRKILGNNVRWRGVKVL